MITKRTNDKSRLTKKKNLRASSVLVEVKRKEQEARQNLVIVLFWLRKDRKGKENEKNNNVPFNTLTRNQTKEARKIRVRLELRNFPPFMFGS